MYRRCLATLQQKHKQVCSLQAWLTTHLHAFYCLSDIRPEHVAQPVAVALDVVAQSRMVQGLQILGQLVRAPVKLVIAYGLMHAISFCGLILGDTKLLTGL